MEETSVQYGREERNEINGAWKKLLASMDKWRTMGHSLIQTDLFITFQYGFKSTDKVLKNNKAEITVDNMHYSLWAIRVHTGYTRANFGLVKQHLSNNESTGRVLFIFHLTSNKLKQYEAMIQTLSWKFFSAYVWLCFCRGDG